MKFRDIIAALFSTFATLAVVAQTEVPVWLGMTQQELDAAYDQAVYAANLEQVLARQAENSRIAIANLGEPTRYQYGTKNIESLDVYSAAGSDNPTLVYVHGGTWRFGVAADNAFAAETFVNAGINFVVLDFSSVDDFSGDLEALVAQLKQATRWLHENGEREFSADIGKMFLAGFSSGAHLAAQLLIQDWTEAGLSDYPFAGALLCSGMYDMAPVALSFRREFVNLTEDSIPRLSPIRHVTAIDAPVLVAYGSQESPEFKRQADEFTAALISAQVDAHKHFPLIPGKFRFLLVLYPWNG